MNHAQVTIRAIAIMVFPSHHLIGNIAQNGTAIRKALDFVIHHRLPNLFRLYRPATRVGTSDDQNTAFWVSHDIIFLCHPPT